MPAKTARQRRFAGMSLSAKGRATLRAKGKKPMPRKVAKKFARKA